MIATAVGLALGRSDEKARGPAGIVQVGGRSPSDLLRAASTPVLAVDPENEDRLVLANRIERPRFSCSVFASSDGGRTWRPSRFELPPVGERCYAPQVAFARAGRAYLLATTLEGRGNEPFGGFLYQSLDGGATFGRPRQVLPRYAFQTALAAMPDGALAVSFLSGSEFSRHATFGLGPPPNPVALTVSRDRGRSFSATRWVSARARELVGGPVLAIGSQGQVHVLYWDYLDDVFDHYSFPGRYGGRFQLVLAVSRDGGRSFEESVVDRAVVPGGPFLSYLPPLPALAIDRETGALYAAWEDARTGSSDVLFRRSTDGGRTWSPARLLIAGPADERTPALAVSADGRLVAAAYRLVRGGGADVVVRASDDGGRTFSEAATLTRTPFDTRIAPTMANHAERVDLGSKIALVRAGEEVLAAWADTRRGTRDTGKVDILLTRVPGALPPAHALRPAPNPPPARASRIDRRLRGGCSSGPRYDSRGSSLAVVRSFLSALERGELQRAYGYLDARWRKGRAPVRRPHLFAEFSASFRALTCARLALAESYDRSADGEWNTFRVWVAARRGSGSARALFGLFWTHSDTSRAPWSLMGYWARELPAR